MSVTTCPECGTQLSGEASRSFCPKCLYALALDNDDLTEPLMSFQCSRGRSFREEKDIKSPQQFGDYELIEEITRGGMGVVYMARQRSLNRTVAVKMILAGQFASKEVAQRFKSEAIAAAVLKHPNIVPVHEVGVHSDQHFFSMEYVEGQNLAQLVGIRPLPPKQAARYVKLIAEAIHYAHQQGILHRDLKPSNVLVEAATDQPRVTDFGLAKRLDSGSSITLTGQILGSPNFMPPEQASSTRGKVGRQSDVYGLGGILYYLLTARAPFQGDTLEATIQQVLHNEPISPRILNRGVPRDIQTICLKCLEKMPTRRYATAQEVAEELGRFLRDEPICARAITRAERAWRWCYRNPVIAILSTVSSLLVVGIAVGAPIVAFQLNRERQHAEASARSESGLRETAQAQAYTSDMNRALQSWEEGNLKQARTLLDAYVPTQGQTDLRGFEWRYLWNLCQDKRRYTNTLAGDSVRRLVTSPAHSFVAAACDQSIRLLEPSNGRELARLAYPNPEGQNAWPVVALASGMTNLLVAHRASGIIGVWDLLNRELMMSFKAFSNEVGVVALSPDGKYLAAADQNPSQYYGAVLSVWDISSRSGAPGPVTNYFTTNAITAMTFSPDGQFLAIAKDSGDRTVIDSWEVKTKRAVELIRNGSTGVIRVIAFSPDGTLLALGGAGGQIKLWDLPKRQFRDDFDGHAGDLESLTFSADGKQMLSSGADGTIRRWDISPRKADGLWRLPESGEVRAVIAPDGNSIVSALAQEVSIWGTDSLQEAVAFHVPQGWSWPIISPDSKTLIISALIHAGGIQHATAWDLDSGRKKFDLVSKEINPHSVAFSPNGALFAMASVEKDGFIGLWDTTIWNTGAREYEPLAYLTNGFETASLSFSPDGKMLATAGPCFPFAGSTERSSETNRLAFWDVGSRKRLNLLAQAGIGKTECTAAASVSFSPDGRLLAVGSRDGWVRLWEIKQERMLKEFKVDNVDTWGAVVIFSPNSRWLASYSENARGLVVVDLEAAQTEPWSIEESADMMSALFTADNKTLITAYGNGVIKLWNLRTRTGALTVRHGRGPGGFLAMAPNENVLASKDGNGVVKIWSATPVREIPTFKIPRQNRHTR